MYAVIGKTFCMESVAKDGYFLSVIVNTESYLTFVYYTDKTPMDYLMNPILDGEVELCEGWD